MKIIASLIALCFVCAGVAAQTPDANYVIEQSAAKLRTANLFQYDSEYRIKIFDSADTTAFARYDCTVTKAPQDTILNFNARVSNDEEERIYDGENFYLIWHPTQKIVTDNPYVTGRSFAKNNIKREHIPAFIYAERPFNSYLTEAVKTEMAETVWKGKAVWRVEIWMPTDAEITFFKRVLYIDKESSLPVRIESFAKFQNIQDEYWEQNLDWKTVETSGLESFSFHYTYPKGYKMEVYKPSDVDLGMLPVGASIPAFIGIDPDGDTISLDSTVAAGALILLDFWYLGCTPCMRAMPGVNALAEKYRDEGLVVLGLNPVDDFKKRASDLDAFTEKMNLQYPLFSVDPAVSKAYNIKVYPAMYIIENGKVVYAHYGHSEEKMKELERVLKGML